MNYTKVIQLGKRLVDELNKNESSDFLNMWMAHYIAELIEKVNISKGKEKEKYQKECFDAILKLWTHIDKVPNVDIPLRSFSNIFEMCEKLTTQKYKYFPEKYKDEMSPYLLFAQKVDLLAKEIVKLLFSLAIAEASEEEKEWLKFDILDDVISINRVIVQYLDILEKDDENLDINSNEKKKLKKSIEEFNEAISLLKL